MRVRFHKSRLHVLARLAARRLPAAFRRAVGELRRGAGRPHAWWLSRGNLANARIAQTRLLEALDGLPEGVVILDKEGRYVCWNKQYAAMYAATVDRLVIGGKLEDAIRVGIGRGEYPEAIGREDEWIAERLARLKNPGPRFEQTLGDGRCILIEDRPTSDGGMVSLRVDITEMKQREASFRLLFDNNPLPMLLCSRSGAITGVNDAAVKHYGYAREAFLQLSLADIQRSADANSLVKHASEEMFDALARETFTHVRRDGETIDVELRARSMVYEGQPSVLLAVIDITERCKTENRARHLARHDALTGLPNRFLLAERMQDALGDAERGNGFAVLFLDLDKFKIVNDTLGHAMGDNLLREAAVRVSQCVGPADTVARLGGDEFAVLLQGGCSRERAEEVGQRILLEMQKPMVLAGKEIYVGVSIGIAMAPANGTTPGELFRCSDVAMYAAKQQGRGTYLFHHDDMDEKLQARHKLEEDLRETIAGGLLQVHYQPLVALESGAVSCMEALVRWNHPTLGYVPPAEFIPIAEETGMIVALGDFVLRRACKDAAAWPAGIKVAVNISALELERADFRQRLSSALSDSGLPASSLQLEVTETAVMCNVDHAISLLTEIRKLGVEIAMDDFGTGYSSLGSLCTFPFDKIKIDRAFIREASNSAEGREMLCAIVALAKSLGLSTTVEGVESVEQQKLAQALSCTEVQGFLFSAARPADQLADLFDFGAAIHAESQDATVAA